MCCPQGGEAITSLIAVEHHEEVQHRRRRELLRGERQTPADAAGTGHELSGRVAAEETGSGVAGQPVEDRQRGRAHADGAAKRRAYVSAEGRPSHRPQAGRRGLPRLRVDAQRRRADGRERVHLRGSLQPDQRTHQLQPPLRRAEEGLEVGGGWW